MKKIIKFIVIFSILFFLSGCQNYQEINNYAIVSGISIDKSESDKEMYTVGIQIMNAKKDEENSAQYRSFCNYLRRYDGLRAF